MKSRRRRLLQAVVDGTSQDERSRLSGLPLDESQEVFGTPPIHPDDILVADWRQGSYPHENLMPRKSYERQKQRLQVELLKLQAWTNASAAIRYHCSDPASRPASRKGRASARPLLLPVGRSFEIGGQLRRGSRSSGRGRPCRGGRRRLRSLP